MKKIISIINDGGVVVHRTDTLYGLLASAKNRFAVDKIYSIKKRDLLKPVVVLISHINQIEEFGITINGDIRRVMDSHWPGKVSIIVPVEDSLDLHYIHKGTGSIAFRLPDDENLLKLIDKTGPLVAPSANPEGMLPAKNIEEAMAYFGDSVDYYENGGECSNLKASKIIRILDDGEVETIRE